MRPVDQILPLRLQTLARFPEYRLDEPGVASVRAALAAHLETATKVELLRCDHEVTAAMVLGAPRPSMLGLRTVDCLVVVAATDEQTSEWVRGVLTGWKDLIDERFVLVLPPAYEPLLPALFSCGLQVQALILHGIPDVGRAALGAAPSPEAVEQRWGLRIEPLRTDEQVERLVALRRDYFRRHSHNSPLSDARTIDGRQQAAIDDYVRGSLLAATRSAPPTTQFVVRRADDVVGGFGLVLSDTDSSLGRCAGLEVFLDPSIHGRGVGTLVYQIALAQMAKLDVRVFRGTTANQGVIHIARKIRRSLRGWKLVPGRCGELPPHFDYPLRD